MKTDIVIKAETRDSRGKNEARRLRAGGLAPAVVYGAGGDPIPVSVDPIAVNKIMHSATGSNTIFNVDLGGDVSPVKIVDWQYDPIKSRLLHVDLQRVDMSRRMTVKVPVTAKGDPRGVKEQGGLLELVSREVEVECLPADIPDQFVVDVKELLIGQNVRASDLQLGEGVKLTSPADAVLVHVIAIRAAAETPAEGAPAAAATAEPEVIKKGKKEEEAAADDKKKK
jgi:large subunit ribosomal protein L25